MCFYLETLTASSVILAHALASIMLSNGVGHLTRPEQVVDSCALLGLWPGMAVASVLISQ